jgi:hypothetical protein
VLNTSVFELPAISGEVLSRQPLAFENYGDLPDLPSRPETLITLELRIGEWPMPLGEIVDAVLGDPGATIQILRLAGREYGSSEFRPERIEDCICDLGADTCLAEAARGSQHRRGNSQEIAARWRHATDIAHCCRFLAEEACGSIKPHQAYLAGLLHEMGSLPALLGWDRNDLPANAELCALRLAERWNFPAFLKDSFREMCRLGRSTQWSKLIGDAHQLAGGSEMSGAFSLIADQLPA